MLRWTILRQHARGLRPPRFATRRSRQLCAATTGVGGARWISCSPLFGQRTDSVPTHGSAPDIGPPDLERVNKRYRTDAWLSLLEATLPPHLRQPGASVSEDPSQLSPDQIYSVLCAAEKTSIGSYGRDILSYIAYEQGRWSLVVWLVKHLVESFGPTVDNSNVRTSSAVCQWKNDTPLDELTRAPIDPQRPDFLQHSTSAELGSPSFLQSIADHDASSSRGRDALGMVWRGLGNMTIACADGEIKPEILEIIAFLHHQEFMPSAIYDAKPLADPTAIQQSPILNLLSSRMLTSLSDAAWTAHAKQIQAQTKSQSGGFASLRPEIPGASYRVRVAGLKPEVWLELILWSCLHGGWVVEGMDVLQKLHATRGEAQWRPLSWRSLVSQHPSGTRDWEQVEYMFNNWNMSSMDVEEPSLPVSVHKTVSSEVINAYVDATVSILRPSESRRGIPLAKVGQFIGRMQQFLGRSSLALGAGSWDAVVLRLFDLQDNRIYKPQTFDQIIRLSPKMGQEIATSNVRNLPDYVFDGTAAMFGLFHRALHHRIVDADVEGALRLFASLQERADENKRQSVADFLQRHSGLLSGADDQNAGQFTANYSKSIDYPAFYVQIPPNILGPFIELVTDAKAYDFGKWLLYSEEIDGPIVPESLYGDPSITPALVRFAAETSDKALLSRLVKARSVTATQEEPTLPSKVLRSFLESQINLMRWPAAMKILDHMKDTYGLSWNIITLCHFLRVSLSQVKGADAGSQSAKENFGRSRGLFRQLVQRGYEKPGERPDYLQEQIDNLLVVLALVEHGWTGFAVNTQAVTGYRAFNLPPKAFNLLLEGVVDVYGSEVGRRLIDTFWNHRVRDAQLRESEGDWQATRPPFSSFGRTLPSNLRRQRTEIRLPGSSGRKVAMYGGLRPDLMTIRIVLKKAMEEIANATEKQMAASTEAPPAPSAASIAESDANDGEGKDGAIDASPAGTVAWCGRRLKRLGMTTEDLASELRRSLPEQQVLDVLEKAPELLATTQGEQDEGDGQDED